MFDLDEDGKLNQEDLGRVLVILGIEFITPDGLMAMHAENIAACGGVTFKIFRDICIAVSNMFTRHEGKYYVLLSLQEAEHLRGVFHSRIGQPLIPNEANGVAPISENGKFTAACMWLLGDEAVQLAVSRDYSVSNPAHHSVMESGYRFLNTELFFDNKALIVLLRALEENPTDEREKWWLDVRSCRHRRQQAIDNSTPIHTVFTTSTEYLFLEYKATIQRVQMELQERGFLVLDAFRAFNSSQSGLMTCSEFYGGLTYLDLEFTKDQIYDLMSKLAIDQIGLVSYAEFRRVFQESEEDLESRGVNGGDGASSFEVIQPRMIPELYEANKEVEEVSVDLTQDILQHFKIKVKPVSGFSSVWSSQGTQSQTQVSVWAPVQPTAILKSNRGRLCLGYYASKGFNNPLGGWMVSKTKYQCIEVTDYVTIRLKRNQVTKSVLVMFFPHPLRYKKVWSMSRSDKSLFAWKAVPPEGFVALGMICTSTGELKFSGIYFSLICNCNMCTRICICIVIIDDMYFIYLFVHIYIYIIELPPSTDIMRCVPLAWCSPSKVKPTQIWNDTGAGGGKPGSMWTINSLDMMVIKQGHEPPTEVFYELNAARFFLESNYCGGCSTTPHK